MQGMMIEEEKNFVKKMRKHIIYAKHVNRDRYVEMKILR